MQSSPAWQGDGTVVVPAGTSLDDSLYRKSHVDFYLMAEVVLLASPNREDYNVAGICLSNSSYRSEFSSRVRLILYMEQEHVAL